MAADIVLTGSFLAVSAGVVAQVGAVVQATGEEVRQGAADRSRVDTGEMQSKWVFQMTGPTEGVVSNDSDHVLPNEYGTVHMSAAPMLHPAVDAARQGFEDGLRAAVGG